MAWENRNRCNRYYYSGRKQHGVVSKEYLGRGIAAALIASALLKQKQQRTAFWTKRRILLKNLRQINRLIRSFFQFSRQLERLLRFIEKEAKPGMLQALSPMTIQPIEPPTTIQEAMSRAKQGDPEALPQLIEQEPRLWQHFNDLARQAQESQLNALAGEDQFLKATIQARFNALRIELGDGCSNVLEQIIIERILISWLQAQHADLLLAKTAPDDSRITNLLLKRADQCQGRMERAITKLQAMRKPPLPQTKKKRSLAGVL
jgi:hypothetical protein